MIVNRYAAGKWNGWTALKGTAAGMPGCARIAAGWVACAVRNGQNRLVAYQFDAGTGSGPVSAGLSVPLSTNPSCAGLAAKHAPCAGLDVNGAVQAATFDGAAWKLLPVLPTVALSPVACSPDDRGHAICVWTTTGNHVLAVEYNGTKWLPVTVLGGRAAGPPRVYRQRPADRRDRLLCHEHRQRTLLERLRRGEASMILRVAAVLHTDSIRATGSRSRARRMRERRAHSAQEQGCFGTEPPPAALAAADETLVAGRGL